jgi:hypothetical protein
MKSTKPRQNFYTQIEFQSFHTAWVKTGKAQREQMFSALPLKPDIAEYGRHVRFVPGAVFGRSGFSSASACLKTLSISD